MLLNRWTGNPVTPFTSLSRELDRMFEGVLDRSSRDGNTSAPALALWEEEGSYHVELEIPGVLADDLDVSVHGNRVTVKGERVEVAREGAKLHRREWGALEFARSFELPVDIDDKGVVAELDHGILRLTLPKAEGHKPRKVKVLTAK